MPENYVVCETEAAIVYHLRKGIFQQCGEQDSRTLCNRKPASDTRIPVTLFDADAHIDPGTRRCGRCMEAYQDQQNAS